MSHKSSENTNLFCLMCALSQEPIISNEEPIAENPVFDFHDGKIAVSKMIFVCLVIKFMLLKKKSASFKGTGHGTVADFSFCNQLYEQSSNRSGDTTDT